MQAESFEKIRKALCQKVKPCAVLKYRNGDPVYFKRYESNHWMGLGKVMGIENKSFGETWRKLLVHSCCLKMYNNDLVEELNRLTTEESQSNMEKLEDDSLVDQNSLCTDFEDAANDSLSDETNNISFSMSEKCEN